MATPVRPEPLSYGSYLKIPTLLQCQEPGKRQGRCARA